jgi:hypothetical protein
MQKLRNYLRSVLRVWVLKREVRIVAFTQVPRSVRIGYFVVDTIFTLLMAGYLGAVIDLRWGLPIGVALGAGIQAMVWLHQERDIAEATRQIEAMEQHFKTLEGGHRDGS